MRTIPTEPLIPASGSAYNLVQRTELSASVRHVRTRTTGGSVATRFEYVHRDHLGSVAAVTSSTGVVLDNPTSFDPFGGRRAQSWAGDISSADLNVILSNEDERWARGFTDHEMLNRTGLIHMNGRVYDPRIGRFVSPDPIVQAPTFSQSYNRYAYVFNNPLSYTDPSGFDAAGTSGYQNALGIKKAERLSDPDRVITRRDAIDQIFREWDAAQAERFNAWLAIHSRVVVHWGNLILARAGALGGKEPTAAPAEVVDGAWSGVADSIVGLFFPSAVAADPSDSGTLPVYQGDDLVIDASEANQILDFFFGKRRPGIDQIGVLDRSFAQALYIEGLERTQQAGWIEDILRSKARIPKLGARLGRRFLKGDDGRINITVQRVLTDGFEEEYRVRVYTGRYPSYGRNQ